MTMLSKVLMVFLAAAMSGYLPANAKEQDKPVNCDNCEEWNKQIKPFNIYGNTWYVGVEGLSALLVTSPKGHILLDGGLPQSAPLIVANIKALGFRIKDVKLILNTHAHWDHSGGIPALQRASGAMVIASASSAKGLKSGTNVADDPQFQANPVVHVAKINQVKVVREGEIIKLGTLALTAHMTPGHTPGSTTWSWTSCEGQRCQNVVYVDSLNPAVSGDFTYSGKDKTPDISASFAASIAKVAALNCDIVISVHPGFTDVLEKAAARTAENNPFIDTNGCRAYAADASQRLATKLAIERGEALPDSRKATEHESH